MAQDLNTVLFGDVTFSNLLETIYKNCRKKEKVIRELIISIKDTITSPQEATLIVPLLKEYLEIGVKNDELLIKMAAIAQRAITVGPTGDDKNSYQLTDIEKKQLFELVDQTK